MSGICGVVDREGNVDAATLSRLVAPARHRAETMATTWFGPGVGFAHLGRVVASERDEERQPVVSRRGTVVVADARLDNRAELTARLGRRERTVVASDAALILAAYDSWGTDCAAHLLGDFAFVVWDPARRRLFAARDVMGMRALYYRLEPRRNLFATELKQILAVPGVPVRLFEPMVAAHLAGTTGSLAWTFYEGVASLPAGTALVADDDGHHTWRFWDVDPGRRIVGRDCGEYAEQFREIFLEAVRCRLRGTERAGVVLSGGVDSGSVASAAGWLLRQGGAGLVPEVRAYSWAFSELTECDERHISQGIVDHYGLVASDVPADDAWPLQDYPAHGPDQDDPFIGVYQTLWRRVLAQAAAEGAALLLTGSRGDLLVGAEVFDELGLLRRGRWADVAHDLRLSRRETGASWPRTLSHRLLRPAAASAWPPQRAPALRRRLTGRRMLPPWIRPSFARQVRLFDLVEDHRPAAPMPEHARRHRYELIYDPTFFRVVTWMERLHAARGLEHVDPWSDRRLVEFVLALPQHEVQRVGSPKHIAREAMRGIMPEAVRRATRKITPEPLFHRAMKDRARETVLGLLTHSHAAAAGYVDEQAMVDHYAASLDGEPLWGHFWFALTLEMWLRRYHA